jgi:hypothetical protein
MKPIRVSIEVLQARPAGAIARWPPAPPIGDYRNNASTEEQVSVAAAIPT